MKDTNTRSPLVTLVKGAGLALLGTVGAWIGYSAFKVDHHLPLPAPIDVEPERFAGKVSRFLTMYVDRSGTGRPLVLIHSINAAASSYELRPIFEHYRGTRPVYALDLPGFGLSERADRVYSPELYKEAILDLLRLKVNEPADVVALSLGCEFAARAAVEAPDLFHSLTFISPSGFTAPSEKRASQQASDSGTSSAVYRAFAFPLWSQAFYDLLGTQWSIHYFLQQSFVGEVDAGLEAFDYATSHQPGARYAPLYFVSGQLFTPDIRESFYERLTMPVLVLYDRDAFVRFDTLPDVVARHANWRAVRIAPTLGLPQFEKLVETVAALDASWAEASSNEGGSSED